MPYLCIPCKYCIFAGTDLVKFMLIKLAMSVSYIILSFVLFCKGCGNQQ